LQIYCRIFGAVIASFNMETGRLRESFYIDYGLAKRENFDGEE